MLEAKSEVMRTLVSGLKFSLADRKADAEQVINKIGAVFQTNDNDKDRNDGISESYMQGSKVLGKNVSWGKDLVFRDHTTDYGQTFDISKDNIRAKDVGQIKYNWTMDNDDRWNVNMQIFVTLANGSSYVVGSHYWNIHDGAKYGSIDLAW